MLIGSSLNKYFWIRNCSALIHLGLGYCLLLNQPLWQGEWEYLDGWDQSWSTPELGVEWSYSHSGHIMEIEWLAVGQTITMSQICHRSSVKWPASLSVFIFCGMLVFTVVLCIRFYAFSEHSSLFTASVSILICSLCMKGKLLFLVERWVETSPLWIYLWCLVP